MLEGLRSIPHPTQSGTIMLEDASWEYLCDGEWVPLECPEQGDLSGEVEMARVLAEFGGPQQVCIILEDPKEPHGPSWVLRFDDMICDDQANMVNDWSCEVVQCRRITNV